MIPLFARWCLVRSVLHRAPICTTPDGVRIGHFKSFSEYLMRHRGLSQRDWRVIHRLVSGHSGVAAMDIGANLGFFSLTMARAGFHPVLAYEPIPETYSRLIRNIALNRGLADKIRPFNCGLGRNSGWVDFCVAPNSPGQNKISHAGANAVTYATTAKCKVVTLAETLASNGIEHVRLMKIDVEGYEHQVLLGGADLLARQAIDFLYLEVIPAALQEAGSSFEDLVQFLGDAGYQPIELAGSRRFQTLSPQEALVAAGASRNILFKSSGSLFP